MFIEKPLNMKANDQHRLLWAICASAVLSGELPVFCLILSHSVDLFVEMTWAIDLLLFSIDGSKTFYWNFSVTAILITTLIFKYFRNTCIIIRHRSITLIF